MKIKIDDKDIQLTEKKRCCANCKYYSIDDELCYYSLSDKDYDCRLRKWELDKTIFI